MHHTGVHALHYNRARCSETKRHTSDGFLVRAVVHMQQLCMIYTTEVLSK